MWNILVYINDVFSHCKYGTKITRDDIYMPYIIYGTRYDDEDHNMMDDIHYIWKIKIYMQTHDYICYVLILNTIYIWWSRSRPRSISMGVAELTMPTHIIHTWHVVPHWWCRTSVFLHFHLLYLHYCMIVSPILLYIDLIVCYHSSCVIVLNECVILRC